MRKTKKYEEANKNGTGALVVQHMLEDIVDIMLQGLPQHTKDTVDAYLENL
jgi:hypothetical protein